MANNYMYFCEVIPDLSKEALEWVEEVLGFDPDTYSGEARSVLAALLGVEGEDLDEYYWPCFNHEINGSDLLLFDNGESFGFGFGDVVFFVQALIRNWKPDYIFTMTWAGVSSPPKCGEFGGGWAMVTADVVDYEDTWSSVVARVGEYTSARKMPGVDGG